MASKFRRRIMAKNAHLTIEERHIIEISLRDNLTFKEIADIVGKDPSTISKEIRGHFKVVEKPSYNPCANRRTCKHYGDLCTLCKINWNQRCKNCDLPCYTRCPDFEKTSCMKLTKPPYVCNGCKSRNTCRLKQHLYDAKFAQIEYESVRSESRSGFAIDSVELKRIDNIITPLVKQGHSVHQICVNNADQIMLDEKTIYNYIDAGLFSIHNIDLPRKVRYRVRKKKKTVRVDKKCHIGRTYEDFKSYTVANPDVSVVEMDSVEGRKGGKVLLTIYFRNSSLMLAFIREQNTARSVTDIFNKLYVLLGHKKFTELFQVIITDRGSEFTNPLTIEFNENGERRTRIFYCDPQCSNQKGGCEVTHEMIRRVLPKKTSFDNLTQEDVSLLMSHINSYTRKKLNDKSANQLFSFFHGENTLDLLGIKVIPVNEINLTKNLLKK